MMITDIVIDFCFRCFYKIDTSISTRSMKSSDNHFAKNSGNKNLANVVSFTICLVHHMLFKGTDKKEEKRKQSFFFGSVTTKIVNKCKKMNRYNNKEAIMF